MDGSGVSLYPRRENISHPLIFIFLSMNQNTMASYWVEVSCVLLATELVEKEEITPLPCSLQSSPK